MRLDRYLSEKGYSLSREKAKKEILSGWVKVGGERCHDPSKEVQEGSEIEVARPGGIYVSRGGYKLEKALKVFSVRTEGICAADLGASTGGFTDCLLKNGAVYVYAVDVGYGQLDYSLRSDDKVCVYERTNARSLTSDMFTRPVSLVVSDLSFISFSKVFPVIREVFIRSEGITLVKPQFESKPGEHKKGVVRSEKAHADILRRLCDSLLTQKISIHGIEYSPIKGPKGNIEFLLYYDTFSAPGGLDDDMISSVVSRAHAELN